MPEATALKAITIARGYAASQDASAAMQLASDAGAPAGAISKMMVAAMAAKGREPE